MKRKRSAKSRKHSKSAKSSQTYNKHSGQTKQQAYYGGSTEDYNKDLSKQGKSKDSSNKKEKNYR